MSLNAGRLRHRVTIQANTPTQDTTTGALTDSWADFATVWAEVSPLGARELREAQSQRSEVTAKITIRYLAGITSDMRIKHGSDYYDIEQPIPDPISGTEWLTIPATRLDPSQYGGN